MDIKCETLMSLTAFVQQRDTFGSAESNKLVDSLVQQGLLTEHPMGTPQLHAKWSNATQQWLDTLLGLISNAQVYKQHHPARCPDQICAPQSATKPVAAEHQVSASMPISISFIDRLQHQSVCQCL